MARTPRPELQPFIELNAQEKVNGKKIPWADRYELIKLHFPMVERIDWRKAFRDNALWGRVYHDIYDDEQKKAGRQGSFDIEQARERFRRDSGEDYSYLPFAEAFNVLAGKRSVRHLATKTGLGPKVVWQLRTGRRQPDLYLLETIAQSFDKDPSYFAEYRIFYILGALGDQMEQAPEISVNLYQKIRSKNNGN